MHVRPTIICEEDDVRIPFKLIERTCYHHEKECDHEE